MEDNLFKRPVKIFPRRSIVSKYENNIWSVDLVDMTGSIKGSQRGYILNCVDVFTRKLYSKVMNSKSEEEITNKFKEIFKTRLEALRAVRFAKNCKV